MLGLGEKMNEVLDTMDDLRAAGCAVLTMGQYLQPTRNHYPVQQYVSLEMFAHYKEEAIKRGFQYVESGPLVRSSYYAEKHIWFLVFLYKGDILKNIFKKEEDYWPWIKKNTF